MSNTIIFEDEGHARLRPLTYWRPVCDLRCGRGTLRDLASRFVAADGAALWVRPELAEVVRQRCGVAVNEPAAANSTLINGRWLPEGDITALESPLVGVLDDTVVFVLCDEALGRALDASVMLDAHRREELLEHVPRSAALGRLVDYPWDLLERSAQHLEWQWQSTDAGLAGDLHRGAHCICDEHIHLAAGASVGPGAVIDASNGPVYIDVDARVLANAVVEGPTYIGRGAQINTGAWVRNGVTIGPGCKLGGEIGISVFQGRSNKQHHGFVGHCCIGEWVNLGAGTTTSNLKNTYGSIRVAIEGVPVDSGRMFMGSVIGDFARPGINQSLTTGGVVGMASSVVTCGMTPAFVPSFRFLTDRRDEPYDAPRCLEVAIKMMGRRKVTMSQAEREYFMQLAERCPRYESL